MILRDLIRHLQTLEELHGDLEVYAVHSASGVADPVGYPMIDMVTGDEEAGPDLDEGMHFVSISIGH
jgi:hypothetical protein